ncbi:Uncharacterised protein [Mycobacteroides abscessus subsp. abscessus]|nr:Uncharacterised protein [Mycobacteroides abscessus subsp. abscessus]
MATEDRPMIIRVISRDSLRPTRSPMWDITSPPMGRTM